MKFFPHQVEASDYLMKGNGGYLFIEQRGGKTKPTVHAFLGHHRLYNVLIITKATSLVVWKKELELQGLFEGSIVLITGTEKQRIDKLDSGKTYKICNWDMVKDYKVIDWCEWDTVVFDETSCIANGTASVTRYVIRAMRRLRERMTIQLFVCGLSGNPSPESPIQYATQAMAIEGEYFGHKSIDTYIQEFWKDNLLKPGVVNKMIVRNPLHLVDIKAWIKRRCFVRTLEGLGLGSKILYSRRSVRMNAAQKKAIPAMLSEASPDIILIASSVEAVSGVFATNSHLSGL